MKIFINIILLICIVPAIEGNNQIELKSFYDYNANDINGKLINMSKYKGKKVLVVNVASKCGYTYQYEGLQKLHEIYIDSLTVLGFPSNDFFWQEPGTNEEIQKFCKINYGVTFQMFEKIHVKGEEQHPLFQWLSNSKLNGWNDNAPSWNFCKYLINEKGNLIDFYKSKIEPTDTLITRHLGAQKTIFPVIE